jgi:carbonic anhydrase
MAKAKKTTTKSSGDDPKPDPPMFDQKSPIDLKDSFYHPFDVGQAQFSYPLSQITGVREGTEPDHMVFTVKEMVRIPLFGLDLKLDQLHFHAASEHQINGVSWPLELHLVHSIKGGQTGPTVGSSILVIGVFFFPATEAHPKLRVARTDSFYRGAKEQYAAGAKSLSNEITFNPNHCLPDLDERERFFRYEGSLTSGTLAEKVSWLVFERPVPVLTADIEPVLKEAKQPQQKIQSLNRRIVLRSFA